ncbi:phenylalanine--tRNA ligase subunit alpha, partial [Lactiplantibacillus plantarum]
MSLQDRLTELRDQGLADIKSADVLKKVNQVKVDLLGKKGPITEVLRGMRDLSPEERPKVGAYANEVRDRIQAAIDERREELEQAAVNEQLAAEKLDVTLPGREVPQGQPHVITQIITELEDLFMGMGYQIVDGDEVEEDYYNFER